MPIVTLGSLSKDMTGTSLGDSTPKAENMIIPDGINGNIATVKFMTKIAKKRANHPKVRAFALNIIQSYDIQSHKYVQEALAIGDTVLKRVRYVRDPRDHELLQDPVMMIDQLERFGFASGDCDDMSLLIATLLLAIGHDPFFRCVRYQTNSGNFNHIYVVVYEQDYPSPKKRVVLDAILKDKPIGTEVNHKSGQEYPID